MRKWRAVVFDLDDTLYPERDFVLGGFDAVARWAEAHLGIQRDKGYADLCVLHKSGVRGDTFNRWLEAYNIVAEPLMAQLVQAYREHSPRLKLFPEALGLLSRLGRGHRLGLVSDGYLDVQQRKLDALGIRHLFDAVVFSDEWGRQAWKPSVKPFLTVLQRLDVVATSTVYVADNPLRDFLGARQVGILAVQVLRRGGEYAHESAPTLQHAANLVVNDLSELERLLDSAPDGTSCRGALR